VGLEESHNLNISKLTKYCDYVLALAKVLKNEKSEFDVGHARLIGDFEKLEEAHKVLESKFSGKSYEQLETQLTIEQSKCPDMKSLEVHVPCSSNPCCDHEKLVAENAKLKAQLEKELATLTQGGKSLDTLLASQGNDGKKGLGFANKTKKKKKKNKNKKRNKKKGKGAANPQEGTYGTMTRTSEASTKISNAPTGISGGSTRISGVSTGISRHGDKNSGAPRPNKARPTHNNFAGKYNPHYVLCRDYYGHVYAKYVGPYDGYIEWAIWVPKFLVTNKRGPIKKWVPKNKN
jgi:hypothetical protein